MRRAVSRCSMLTVVLMLVIPAAGVRPSPALAQDDATRFAEVLTARESAISTAGPLSGTLVQEAGFNSTDGAGVFVTDFTATATFVNSTSSTVVPWDMGFSFHRSDTGVQQIVLQSDGSWLYSPYPAGTLQSGLDSAFKADPGAANTLDLMVEDGIALFGINGSFLTRLELPPGVAADVEVGTGYFTGTIESGRSISYEDFTVWSLPFAAVQVETPTPTPAAAPEPTPGVSATDAETFAAILAAQGQVAPLSGPFNANLKEAEGSIAFSWAGVNLADFHASATYGVPAAASATPWDIGFIFRTSPAGTLRIAVDSQSTVWLSIGASTPTNLGTVLGLSTTPGSANTLDLMAAGQRAFLGVNGALAVSFDLPADSTGADVAAGTAFFSDQTEVDRLTPFYGFVVLPLQPGSLGPVIETDGGVSPADVDRFASLLTETGSVAPLVGPFAGRVVESTLGTVPLAASGVVLADFGATATFKNPADPRLGTWDAGFQFRVDGTLTNRVIVDSLGNVYTTLSGQSSALVADAGSYDDAAGALNTLQLFVEADRALFGVNGELAAVIELTAAPVASDVLAGSGFFNEDFVVGRVTDYQDFRVWEIT